MKEVPTSKVSQAVDIIRRSIIGGEWSEFLPGERTLASELMISRACLRRALEGLTQEGILAPAEPSKRRQITKHPHKKASAVSQTVVFFTPEPAHQATPLVLEQLAQLRYHLSKAKMTVELVSSPVFKQQKSSAKTLSRLVRDHADAHWILHQCPEHIQRWFSEHAIRATVLGSLFENIRLPNIDIDFQSASRHATGMLLGKGHKRLGLIRFRSQLAGDDLAVVGMHEAFEAHHGEKLPNPVVLNHNFHVDRLTVELDKLLASPHRPTGLIVLNHHHFVTAFTHLMACGIRIPQDVSIISLSHDVLLSRLSPAPVSYTVGDRLISQLAKLIISPSSGSASRPCLLVPEANPGKTVASAV